MQTLQGPFQPIGRTPLLDVVLDLDHKFARHVQFAFTEHPRNAQNHSVPLVQVRAQDTELIEIMVVLRLHGAQLRPQ